MARGFAKAFYRSKEWKKQREYILKRDKYLCRMCGGVGTQLEVHHIKHLTPSNINDPNITLNEDNLITLCRDCHFKVHEEDKLSSHKKSKSDTCIDEYAFDDNGFLIKKDKAQPPY